MAIQFQFGDPNETLPFLPQCGARRFMRWLLRALGGRLARLGARPTGLPHHAKRAA